MALVTVTVQIGERPAQSPLKPMKPLPIAGVADNVTVVPIGRLAAQAALQWMPTTSLTMWCVIGISQRQRRRGSAIVWEQRLVIF